MLQSRHRIPGILPRPLEILAHRVPAGSPLLQRQGIAEQRGTPRHGNEPRMDAPQRAEQAPLRILVRLRNGDQEDRADGHARPIHQGDVLRPHRSLQDIQQGILLAGIAPALPHEEHREGEDDGDHLQKTPVPAQDAGRKGRKGDAKVRAPLQGPPPRRNR